MRAPTTCKALSAAACAALVVVPAPLANAETRWAAGLQRCSRASSRENQSRRTAIAKQRQFFVCAKSATRKHSRLFLLQERSGELAVNRSAERRRRCGFSDHNRNPWVS